MTDPGPDIHRTALVEQVGQLAELARTADPQAPVPTCPEWTMRQLIAHVGRGDRWAATIVRTRSDEVIDPRTVDDGKPPAEPDAAADWLRGGAQALLDAVDETGADTPVWTFTGPKPAGWWIRRRAHEAAAHRADAAIALGAPFDLDPALAADGVSEWLGLLTALRRRQADGPLLPDGATLHLHATDEGLGSAGEWMIRPDGEGIAWEHGHGKGTVAVRGAAVDLFLALLRRLPADDTRLQVLGEPAVFATWLARTPF
ncbi:maleylpyruvate isomerase family mycothiol-dependent enzyme [Pseudonocardia acidicola]|uniref:Maleylpyruvate isomerase family mycothiol-dependent enzyme n=1 Tax=Pseudonocardia acidicola TaxID=2724939 RepID=A0ABX1S8R7_9PSEU|nr:maleylpyruvate isomerase family mycothiol-dependent enzyme [Pseudonocardia acidicola]NMH97956.1 maleylpyruvate isomerase family mycothiol-dependent enzyme [Pseudonocardia acidicola]